MSKETAGAIITVCSAVGKRGGPATVCEIQGGVLITKGNHSRLHHKGSVCNIGVNSDSRICGYGIVGYDSGCLTGNQTCHTKRILVRVAVCAVQNGHVHRSIDGYVLNSRAIADLRKQSQIAMGVWTVLFLPCPQLAGIVADVQLNGVALTVKSPGKGSTVAVIPPDAQNAGAGQNNRSAQFDILRNCRINVIIENENVIGIIVICECIANKIGGSVESIFPVGSGEIVDGQSMRSAVEFEQTTLNRIIRKIWASQPHHLAPIADVGSVARSWQRTGGNGVHQTIAVFADDPAFFLARGNIRHSDGAVQPQNALGQFSHKAACEAAVYSSRWC